MIFREESQLLQNIKLDHLYRVYLLYGEEKYLKDMYLKKLIRQSVPDSFAEFNFHRFDGQQLDVDAMLEACESMPFLAEYRCVVVDHFDFEAMNTKDKEKITAFLQDPVSSTVLILVVEKEGFQPKKSASARKLVELCDKAGAVAELKKRSQTDLVRFVRSKLEPRGCSLTRDCCEFLIERCEKDMLTLSGEIEKLGAYAQGKYGASTKEPLTITPQIIGEVTCKTVSASVYDLARMILADRFEKAMNIVEDLIYLRYQPTVILSALSGAYLDLYIARTAKNAGGSEDLIKKNFSYKGRDFVVRNSLRDCSKYSLQVLRDSMIFLAGVDFRMKSSRADNELLLEQAVTELFLISSGEKKITG